VQIFRAVSSSSSFAPLLPTTEFVPLGEYWNVHARIHLAYADEETRRRMTATPAARYTDKTVTDPGEIMAGLQKTRAEAVAYSCEEHRKGVCVIGVPVFANGNLVATLGIWLPLERFDEHALRYAGELQATAETMGQRLQKGFA
jgi:DNA-binding IclR family transcriptional regulator